MIKKGTKLLDLLNESQKEDYLQNKRLKAIERSNAQKVLRRFAKKIKELGFNRSKPTFFVRESDHIIEFLHIHKYSFGACFRMHVCIRVMNDTRTSIALLGPTETELNPKVRFDYEDSERSVETCADKMADFVKTEAEAWYIKWSNKESLFQENSPLQQEEQQALKQALTGNPCEQNIELSRKLLKIV